MLLTPFQVKRFWREWSACIRLHHWDTSESELERKAMLHRAGFISLTRVDPDKGFTAVLKELAAMNDNLGGMLQADANKHRQKIFLIKRVPEAYWQKIAQDRFHTTDLEALKDWQIDQLLFTVSDRQAVHSSGTLQERAIRNRQRRANPDPDARIKFHDLAPVAAPEPVREYAKDNAPF
jgi:hypothetical protein